jgi:hypothetical protein
MPRGVVTYPGRLDVPHAWAYLPDLARAFVAIASIPEMQPASGPGPGPAQGGCGVGAQTAGSEAHAHGGTELLHRAAFERFNFAGHLATGAEVLTALESAGDALGLLPSGGQWKRAAVPWWLLRLGALCDPMLRELLEMRYLWDTPHGLDGAALRAALGREPDATPFRAAVQEAVAALGLAGAAQDASASGVGK